MGRGLFAVSSASFVVAVALVACSSKDYDTAGNGVNDVVAACRIGVPWVRTRDECSACIAAAPAARCDCPEFKAYSAACEEQAAARRNEPSCTYEIETCALGCGTDCDCVDRCYANAPGCRRAASARDGCVAEVCDKYCKP